MAIWKDLSYWQHRQQPDGYISLTDLMDVMILDAKQRISLARKIARLVLGLHDRNVVPNTLTIDDVFVKDLGEV